MVLDCAVIGGGPAGLNAALVLGRSRRKTILFDDNKPRNAVTSKSHGFITRDGIHPQEFKKIAQGELSKYPNVRLERQRVHRINKDNNLFQIETENAEVYSAKKIIIATGFKEILPDIPKAKEFYGKSLFGCPYCDGWELKDRPLAVIAEKQQAAFHMAKVVSNWTNDLIIFTNGRKVLSLEEKALLKNNGIGINEKKISSLIGKEGLLEKIQLDDGTSVLREGGFIASEWKQAASFDSLGYTLNEQGGITTDSWQRTNTEGLYACGDTRIAGASQLIIAAAEGSMAAIAVNAALIEEKYSQEK
ncbi:NAD(P)/FAD-dependent oxidoreductase [Bacillus infantis]|uniref:NAD(P)/FAD-dependent oxidoreductase n=1 Tax=Bacillus infantis TaxID=324767 RepID=A0A5D4RAH8_9BACI|nr:NAD(P)/FAD-dependent oxidoreductase [Bacillus infantis]TYS46856.1 NAD(P)/FAD-dependent oxidoreductase [Bacillus infantis]